MKNAEFFTRADCPSKLLDSTLIMPFDLPEAAPSYKALDETRACLPNTWEEIEILCYAVVQYAKNLVSPVFLI